MNTKRIFLTLLVVFMLIITMTACIADQSSKSTADPLDQKSAEEIKQTFPDFEGMDFEGNKIDSSIISEHSVTVMNFWFTTCKPCVDELESLEQVSKKLEEKNGILIGVNAFTQDGDIRAIAEAKEVLEKKGVTYPNIYFNSESDAGKFAQQISVFPSTYVFDKEGNLVGDPIIGGINTSEQMEKLEKLIDTALEK